MRPHYDALVTDIMDDVMSAIDEQDMEESIKTDLISKIDEVRSFYMQ